jgi:hypothetical protein
MYIETSKSKGTGKVNITGSLGDVYLKQYIYNSKLYYKNLLQNTNPYVIPNNNKPSVFFKIFPYLNRF